MDDVTIVPYNPHQDGNRYLSGIIACYQQSFAGLPWNESHICPNCEQQFGAQEVRALLPKLTCPHLDCTGQLKEFWPASQVCADFLSETQVVEDSCRIPSSWIALDQGNVVGICWGYTISSTALAHKVGLPNLTEQLTERFGAAANVLAYQDELAVLPAYRGKRFTSLHGKGIARALVEARHTSFQKLGVTIGAVRTLECPATRTFEWYRRVGFEIISRYQNNPHCVILARSFTDLQY